MTLLDTHVLVWWVNEPRKLSNKARKIIEENIKKGEIFISSISVWEIFLLVKKRKLILTMDTQSWVSAIENLPFVHFLPLDNNILAKSVSLNSDFHQDPADRMIVATAMITGAIVITSDKRILNYPHIQSVW